VIWAEYGRGFGVLYRHGAQTGAALLAGYRHLQGDQTGGTSMRIDRSEPALPLSSKAWTSADGCFGSGRPQPPVLTSIKRMLEISGYSYLVSWLAICARTCFMRRA